MVPLLVGLATLVQRADSTGLRLRYVATVRQDGPVGYRDPPGTVSADGVWLATASETRLRVQRVAGGPVTELGPADARITDLAWLPDGRHLAVRTRRFESGTTRWTVYDVAAGTAAPLWPDHPRLRGRREGDSVMVEASLGDLIQLAWSPGGDSVAGIVRQDGGSALWVLRADGVAARVRTRPWRLSFPAWRPEGRGIGCIALRGERPRLDIDCGMVDSGSDGVEAYGPIAFTPDGQRVFYAAPNERGTLDLRRRMLGGGPDERLTTFARDTYAPGITRDGRVLFKTQDYRVFVADAPAGGGPSRQLTTFQSETPTWSPDGRSLGVTYGTWRRVIDDFHYPDISQDLGIVVVNDFPAAGPTTVFRATPSEDQGMAWSPDGRWVAFHSHADGTDDLYLQPANRSSPARQITHGRYETGWPRWSPDGRWIVIPSEEPSSRGRSGFLSLIGVDPEGGTTSPPRRLGLGDFAGGALHAEWLGNDSIVFDGITALGHKGLYVLPRGGGRPRLLHPYASNQVYSGIAASPDRHWVAFVAPGTDGLYQIFSVSMDGGTVRQVTTDPTDKTQPAFSPDGGRLTFAVFTYMVQFWLADP